MKQNWRNYQNYIIVAVISVVAVFFLPMLGSDLVVGWNIPSSTASWIVWVVTKLCIVAINMLTLDQFIKQGKVNVRDDPRFLEADAYFSINEINDEKIRTPKEFLGGLYRGKMITTTITSALGVFGLTSAILSFDWVSMLTYLFTIVFGLIFGWVTMNKVEEYWTVEYYKLYKIDERKAKESLEMAKTEHSEQTNDLVHVGGGTDILEPGYYFDPISLTVKPVVVDSDDGDNSILGGTVHTSDCPTTRSDIWTKETSQAFKETT